MANPTVRPPKRKSTVQVWQCQACGWTVEIDIEADDYWHRCGPGVTAKPRKLRLVWTRS